MSHAENKVNWCLRKAEKELKEGKKHRGLGKISIDEKFILALEDSGEQERQESSIIEMREFYTYGTTTSTENKEEIKKAVELCRECLDKTKDIVFE